jgi:hypothetical protein
MIAIHIQIMVVGVWRAFIKQRKKAIDDDDAMILAHNVYTLKG